MRCISLIEFDAGKHILIIWAKMQRKELAKLDYPAMSPMFKDYQGGYRASASVDVAKSDEGAEKAGQALSRIHPGLRNALKAVYLERGKCSRQLHNIAMTAFCKEYDK